LNYKAYHSRLHPEDAERNDAIAARAISEKRDFTFEGRLIFDDGRAKVVSINGYPSFDENGDLVSIQGTTQDITDRKRREEEVQRFFNLAVDLFCIVSKEGFILRNSMSFKSALGYSDFELTDMPFIDFVHPTDRDKTQHEIDFILRGGTSRNFENRLLTKTGEYITLSWTSTYDVESQRIYSAAKDITENKLLERNLLESQIELEKSKAKDVFLANMSHEIRTPLNAIMGFNDILSQTALTQDQRRNVNLISNASKTLNVLINDILDISKLENGKLDLEHAPFRVESVAKQVVQMHVSKARTKGVKLLLSYDHEIPDVVIGDETRLLQILLNLVSNAIKFTEEGSVEIRISESQLKDNQVTIDFEVKDTGIGIKSDKLAVIFERFTQAESYTTRMYGGTGLGLNIVRSLVELHNGKLDVKSEFGKGSIFSFSLTFPVASQQQTFLLDSPSLKVEVDGLSDMSVLVVEDNEHNQILADTYLQKHHALVDIAVNGKLAIDMVLKKKYDVILMDIQMPIMDGFTTTNILRTELKIDVPIIGCSAHAMVSERKKCIEVGMNDYISKPYTEDVLIGALAKFKKKPSAKALDEHDDFAAVIAALERNISKTYADKIVHIFKERLPNEVVLLEQSIEERDFELMEERAHYQSGSMSSLHFKKGYQLAYAAERAATEQNADKAAEATNRLIVYLKELMSYLNSVVN
jgi:PAS domain S-box-containing protein